MLPDLRKRKEEAHGRARERDKAVMTAERHRRIILGVDNHGKGHDLCAQRPINAVNKKSSAEALAVMSNCDGEATDAHGRY